MVQLKLSEITKILTVVIVLETVTVYIKFLKHMYKLWKIQYSFMTRKLTKGITENFLENTSLKV